MPKNFFFTKRGQIIRWLLEHEGQIVYVRMLAQKFETSPGNITEMFRELALNGWDVRKHLGDRNTGWLLSKRRR